MFVEITEDEARAFAYLALRGEAPAVFGIPADPIEIDFFDKNGFQAWSKNGFRFEALRYFKVKE